MTNSGAKTSLVLADMLRNYRKVNHLTQDKMCELLSCSLRQYRRYETEGVDSIATWTWIATTLNLPVLSIH